MGYTFISKYYKAVGNNEKSLMDDLKVFSDNTIAKTIEPYNLIIYSIARIKKEGFLMLELSPDEMDIFSVIPPKGRTSLYSEGNGYKYFSFAGLQKVGITEDLIEDIRDAGFFMKYRSNIIIPGEGCPNILAKACKVGKVSTEPSPMRDMYLAYVLSEAEPFKLLCRTDGRMVKLIDIVSDTHSHVSQQDHVEKALGIIRSIRDDASVTYYSLDHKKSVIKVEFPKMKLVKKGKKRYIFTPALTLTISDDTDTKSCIQGSLGINGRLCKIGDSISLCLDDRDIKKRIVPLIKELETISAHIAGLDERELSDRRESIKELASAVDLPSVGQKVYGMYESYLDTIEEISEVDEFAEILSFPSKINYITGKEIPQYVIDKSEKLIGAMLQKYA